MAIVTESGSAATPDAHLEKRRHIYETTMILSPQINEEERNAVGEEMQRLIADGTGEVIEVAPQKQTSLAFPIRKESQGVLATLVFRGPVDLPQTIKERLRHDNRVLRAMTIEVPAPHLR